MQDANPNSSYKSRSNNHSAARGLLEYIIYEDEYCIVFNKPAGLLSIPDREGQDISLKQLLREKYGQIFTVHRLDKDTSGIIVFAKDAATHKYLSQLFEGRGVEKL